MTVTALLLDSLQPCVGKRHEPLRAGPRVQGEGLDLGLRIDLVDEAPLQQVELVSVGKRPIFDFVLGLDAGAR